MEKKGLATRETFTNNFSRKTVLLNVVLIQFIRNQTCNRNYLAAFLKSLTRFHKEYIETRFVSETKKMD